jgi:threonine/homoserine/homoserine lactone efflux protein
VSAGQTAWTLATALGIGALLVASEPVFQALKLAGAAYLVFLGVEALYGALRSRGKNASLPASTPLTAAAAFRQGLISNLGNPKMLAFFTSLLPQFASSFPGLLALGLVFSVLTLAWLAGYTLAVGKASGFLSRPRARRAVEALTGTVLVALGVRLATEPRYWL